MSTAESTSKTSGESGDIGSQSIRAIILSLKPGQVWAVLGVMAALFAGSFMLGSFIAGLRSEVAIGRKDLEVNEAKGAVEKVEKEKQNLIAMLEPAKEIIDTQKFQLQHLELKSDFLHRYYSYVVSNESPAEVKLFSDVVCILWKRSQEARLNIRPDTVFLTPAAIRKGLDQATKDELARNGINHDEIAQELRDLDTQVQRVSRFPSVGPFRGLNPETDRVRKESQSREQEIAAALRSVPPRKIVTFSQVPYEVPPQVAEIVHSRTDCAPSDKQ